jgi:hypothetical protein
MARAFTLDGRAHNFAVMPTFQFPGGFFIASTMASISSRKDIFYSVRPSVCPISPATTRLSIF